MLKQFADDTAVNLDGNPNFLQATLNISEIFERISGL